MPAEAPLLYQPNEGVDPVAFLQKHYGRCLSYFGAEENLLFQDQLRKLDTPLLIAVTNRLQYMRRRGGHNLPLREVLPTRSDRLTMEIQQATRQELETNPRLAAVVAMRARRAEEK